MDKNKSIKQNAEYFHQKMQQQIKKVDAELDNKIG
jgi:1-acyl-sn-glycerol-3-phosphate acyltransferase